jgi:hypothetical protein
MFHWDSGGLEKQKDNRAGAQKLNEGRGLPRPFLLHITTFNHQFPNHHKSLISR